MTAIAAIADVTCTEFAHGTSMFVPEVFTVARRDAHFANSYARVVMDSTLPEGYDDQRSVTARDVDSSVGPDGTTRDVRGKLLMLTPLELALDPIGSSGVRDESDPTVPVAT